MKLLFFTVVSLVICACFNDPYAPPANYVRDDLYCWQLDSTTGKWQVRGLSRECPENATTSTFQVR